VLVPPVHAVNARGQQVSCAHDEGLVERTAARNTTTRTCTEHTQRISRRGVSVPRQTGGNERQVDRERNRNRMIVEAVPGGLDAIEQHVFGERQERDGEDQARNVEAPASRTRGAATGEREKGREAVTRANRSDGIVNSRVAATSIRTSGTILRRARSSGPVTVTTESEGPTLDWVDRAARMAI